MLLIKYIRITGLTIDVITRSETVMTKAIRILGESTPTYQENSIRATIARQDVQEMFYTSIFPLSRVNYRL